MSDFVTSGGLAGAILALVAVEALALLALRARLGRGPSPVGLLANLAAGATLVGALLTVQIGAAWTWTAACLGASLVAHLIDLGSRWRGP